jgi:hypothetical protein
MVRMRMYILYSIQPSYRDSRICDKKLTRLPQLNRRLLLLHAPSRGHIYPPRNVTLRHIVYETT